MKANLGKFIAAAAVVAAFSFCVIVLAYGWVMHALPSSRKVLVFSFVGMAAVGGLAGTAFSAIVNLLSRAGPPKLRMPLSAAGWIIFCVAIAAFLPRSGVDETRLLSLAGVAAFSGLLLGPYHAELFVGLWFLNRLAEKRKGSPTAVP